MFFVLLGIVVGLLVALGPLDFVQTPFDAVANFLVGTTKDILAALFVKVPSGGVYDTGLILTVLFGALAPGLVALVLVTVSKAAKRMRQSLCLIALLGAFGSFFVLPAGKAFVLLVLVAFLGIVVSLLQGAALSFPLMLLATILGIRYGVLIWDGSASEVSEGALFLSSTFGGTSSLAMWKMTLTGLGLAPIVFAGWVALFKR